MSNQEKNVRVNVAVNTNKKAGEQGAEVLARFIKGQQETDPAKMSRDEKRAILKSAKEVKKLGKITDEDYQALVEYLK